MITISKGKSAIDFGNGGFYYGEYHCVANYSSRYVDDKINYRTDNYVVLLDGVVLNRKEITNDAEWGGELLIDLYQKKGERFFSDFQGAFAGALFDKVRDKWIFFHDQLGGRSLYYFGGNNICISTDISLLLKTIKSDRNVLNLSEQGVQMLLDFGITFDGLTLYDGVFRLHPGCYLIYEGGELTEKQYYCFKREEKKLSTEDDYIEMIEESFNSAIKRQFSKEDEYSNKIVTFLSGGVDSRMTVWVSHQLGWKKQLNMTFSNSGWYDETIARKVAKDLKHEWLFKPLDDAQFLFNVDSNSLLTGGDLLFTGVIHGDSITSLIDFEKKGYGYIHTGAQAELFKGEAVFGGGINKNSNYYLDYLKKIGVNSIIDYEDPEITTAINKYLSIPQDGTLSPFLELGFFETTLKIPSKLRKDEYIYGQWVRKMHADANKYVWANSGLPYGSRRFNPMLPKIHMPLYLLPKYFKYKMGIASFGMNPYKDFYNSSQEIKDYFKSYGMYIDAIKDSNIQRRVRDNFNSKILMQHFKAVTILSAIKTFA